MSAFTEIESRLYVTRLVKLCAERGSIFLFLVFMLWIAACGSESEGASTSRTPVSDFLSRYHRGVVFTPGLRSLEEQFADMKALGVDTAKFWLDWSDVQPLPLYYDLVRRTVSTEKEDGYRWFLAQDFETDPGLIEEYAFPERLGSRFAGQVDWQGCDRMIMGLHAIGILAVPLIGDATTAPFVVKQETSSLRMAPDNEGWEQSRYEDGVCHGYRGVGRGGYLGQVFLHAAGAARRYQGVVPLWNAENELNWTPIHVLVAGWRMGCV